MKSLLILIFLLILIQTTPNQSLYNFPTINAYIQQAIQNRVFPGGVLAIGNATHDNIFLKSYGTLTYQNDIHQTSTSNLTLYDIASQTKILGTTASIMKIFQNNLIDLEDLVSKYIPEFAANGKQNVTLRHLLLHCSGMPYDISGSIPKTRDQLFSIIYSSKPLFPLCTATSYSNLGFITLAEVVGIVSKTTIYQYFTNLLKTMQLNNTKFNPQSQDFWRVAPTQYDRQQRHDIIRGTAHQRLAYFLGGVAGHSGYFSTASDILRFGRIMLNGGKLPDQSQRVFPEELVKIFTTRVQNLPFSGNTRAYGFDTGCPGKIMKNCFGHDGSTGTMLWIDKDRKLVFSFLTNRGHPNVGNPKFDAWKPSFADLLLVQLNKMGIIKDIQMI